MVQGQYRQSVVHVLLSLYLLFGLLSEVVKVHPTSRHLGFRSASRATQILIGVGMWRPFSH